MWSLETWVAIISLLGGFVGLISIAVTMGRILQRLDDITKSVSALTSLNDRVVILEGKVKAMWETVDDHTTEITNMNAEINKIKVKCAGMHGRQEVSNQ